MKSRILFFYLALFSTSCSAVDNKLNICADKEITASVVDLNHCINRAELVGIETFGGSIPTTNFKYNNGLEYSIARIPASLATNDLHTKYGMSVEVFFDTLYKNEPSNEKFQLIRSAYGLDNQNKIIKLTRNAIKAYAVIGSSALDSIYVITDNNEFLYQVTGDFTEVETDNIVAKLNI